jgi:metacaspase-1
MSIEILTDEGMAFAAQIANRDRNNAADEKTGGAYLGPRLLAQGDSWFCYPIEFLGWSGPRDVVLALSDEFAVWNLAIPGRRTLQYVSTTSYDDTMAKLLEKNIDILLLSGGGNDLVEDGQLEWIVPPHAPSIDGYLTQDFRAIVRSAMDNLELFVRTALRTRPGLKVVFNAYSYAFPRPDGIWFGGPLGRLGIKPDIQQKIVDKMMDRYAMALNALASRLNAELFDGAQVVVVAATTDAVPNRHDWFDELHPNSVGFRKAAKRMRSAILQVHPLIA